MKIHHFALVLAMGIASTACNKADSLSTVAEPVADPAVSAGAPSAAAPTTTAHEAAAAPKPIKHHEPRPVAAAEPKVICNDCGVITAMTAIKQEGDASGAGAVLGAVAGGVAGHQVGGGRGKDVATAIGAIAGGFGGNMAEKKIREKTAYKVIVKMDSGYSRTVTLGSEAAAGYSVGSKVRVDDANNISPR